MEQREQILIGCIKRLRIFTVPEFGTRASFVLERSKHNPVDCCVADLVARAFIAKATSWRSVARSNLDRQPPRLKHHGQAASASALCAAWDPPVIRLKRSWIGDVAGGGDLRMSCQLFFVHYGTFCGCK
jgi:hypothetical protein